MPQRAAWTVGADKNTGVLRNNLDSMYRPVEIAHPVFGHRTAEGVYLINSAIQCKTVSRFTSSIEFLVFDTLTLMSCCGN
jgi:hypothetical protein